MKLEFDFGKVIPFKDAFQGAGYEKLKRSLLAILLRQKDILFQQSQSPDGEPWAPLSKKAAARKTKKNTRSDEEIQSLKSKNSKYDNHKILVDTGALKNSLTMPSNSSGVRDTNGNEVKLGTNIPYAAIQQYGGTIQIPENKNGFGMGILIPAHQVTIVARPFMGFGKSDESQVEEKIEAYMIKAAK